MIKAKLVHKIISIAIGSILLISVTNKINNFDEFRFILFTYDAIPPKLISASACLLIIVEAIIFIMLFTEKLSRIGCTLGMIFFLVLGFLMFLNMEKYLPMGCGCLTIGRPTTITKGHICYVGALCKN
ncbi:MAG: hypothetical protein K9L17_13355 [Clostridiales bacterium]|nr:hypothetical protein [Clostridiales bacterium]MCF8023662.1 hypothetical protein [Clostridiales bacterium]